MVALRKHAPTRMTVAEFLSWDAGDPTGVPWQLIDGEPVAMAPAPETHAALQGEIGRLRTFLEGLLRRARRDELLDRTQQILQQVGREQPSPLCKKFIKLLL